MLFRKERKRKSWTTVLEKHYFIYLLFRLMIHRQKLNMLSNTGKKCVQFLWQNNLSRFYLIFTLLQCLVLFQESSQIYSDFLFLGPKQKILHVINFSSRSLSLWKSNVIKERIIVFYKEKESFEKRHEWENFPDWETVLKSVGPGNNNNAFSLHDIIFDTLKTQRVRLHGENLGHRAFNI